MQKVFKISSEYTDNISIFENNEIMNIVSTLMNSSGQENYE